MSRMGERVGGSGAQTPQVDYEEDKSPALDTALSRLALQREGLVEVEAGPSTLSALNEQKGRKKNGENPALRYCEPYWHPYRTFCKER